jgi:hypothetical protein
MLGANELTAVVEEFTTEHGVVDLAGFSLDTAAFALRAADYRGAIQSVRVARIADLIRRRPRTRQSLAALGSLTPVAVARACRQLAALGLTSETDGHVAASPRLQAEPILRAVAVEIKVHHWRDGLRQAVQHSLFADESYLAVDLEYLARARRRIELLSDRGVGLIGVDRRRQTAILLERAKRTVNHVGHHRIFASEALVGRLVDGSLKRADRRPPTG